MTALHVHSFSLHDDGTLCAEIADATGRRIHVDVRPDDSPGLMEAYEAFCAGLAAAAQKVMLEILDAHDIPLEVPEPVLEQVAMPVLPCKGCGDPVMVPPYAPEMRADLLRTTFCGPCAERRAR